MSSDLVYFKCVQEGRKLRVRITSAGYNPNANCQFPRAIRRVGGRYSAPRYCVSFARGPAGKFFYRVKKNGINTLGANEVPEPNSDQKISVDKVFESDMEECLVCLENEHDVVIVPCGHYCLCAACANTIAGSTGKCPLCRGRIDLVVTKAQIQT
jgi:hypothetical protein